MGRSLVIKVQASLWPGLPRRASHCLALNWPPLARPMVAGGGICLHAPFPYTIRAFPLFRRPSAAFAAVSSFVVAAITRSRGPV